MRIAIIILAALLLLGCTGERGNPANSTANATLNGSGNLTPGNITAANASGYATFTARSFSFDYPSDMAAKSSTGMHAGTFTGRHGLDGRTGELLAVVYANTSETYGVNADSEFKADPGLAANGFLEADKLNDSAGYLQNAVDVGPTSMFARGRDVFIAEAPFTTKMSNNTYAGYALSLYVPARSLQVQVRILALNPIIANEIMEEFLLSFRIE
jgi:hypothetical protein